ncbi:HET domain-containing protein [Colletotrichum sojae]|uniref:HET domain-containing protein n=1 Tax=Colletotrichum sojae TaxID=2175907 RepID=A0A8H6MNZ7_9PEZI|nr:HET domain-containing protein [Colletotrichum sojae]
MEALGKTSPFRLADLKAITPAGSPGRPRFLYAWYLVHHRLEYQICGCLTRYLRGVSGPNHTRTSTRKKVCVSKSLRLPPLLTPPFEGTWPATYISNQHTQSHAGLHESLGRVKKWLHTCLDHHSECRAPSNQKLAPAKLVEISSNQEPPKLRLVQTRKIKAPLEYAALSYCWGGDQALKLLSHNSAELSQDLPLQALPATIRDAVTLCVTLNISFLWVDALCIVQDDEVSKMEEIAEMSSIYKRAVLTICASSAASATEGFLNPRRSPFTNNQVLRFPCYNKEGVESPIFMGTISTWNDTHVTVDRNKKTEAQEDLLSNRVIFFKRNQLQWKCRGVPVGEFWVDGYEADLSARPVVHSMPSAPPRETDTSWSAWKQKAMKRWDEIVEDYSSRNFSEEADRPLAISGTATEFAEMFRSSDQYVAGFWTSQLPQRLVWKSKWEPPKAHRPKKYTGPTWSWTSFAHPVDMRFRSDFSTADFSTESDEIQASGELLGYVPKLRIESAPYGAVGEGTALLVKGRCTSCSISPLGSEIPHSHVLVEPFTDEHGHMLFLSSLNGWTNVFDYQSDAQEYSASNGKGYSRVELLTKIVETLYERGTKISGHAVANDSTMVDLEIWGLILAPAKVEEMTFTRVGCFRFYHHGRVEAEEADSFQDCLKEKLDAEMASRHPFNGVEAATVTIL